MSSSEADAPQEEPSTAGLIGFALLVGCLPVGVAVLLLVLLSVVVSLAG